MYTPSLFIIKAKRYVEYVVLKLSRFILFETRGLCVLNINLSRDPCRWGSKSKSKSQTQQAVGDSIHSAPPGSGGQSKEKGVYKVNPKKQHRNQQELLKALFYLDTAADQQLSPALEKQAFTKTLQIGFQRLFRLLPWQTQGILLPRLPPLSKYSDLCCCLWPHCDFKQGQRETLVVELLKERARDLSDRILSF